MRILYETPAGIIETIVFDGMLEAEFSSDLEITEHPVSEGADVTDHARKALDEPVITAAISNDPEDPTYINGIRTRQGFDLTQLGGTTDEDGTKLTRTEAVDRLLQEIQANAYVCTVFTMLRTYRTMLLKSFSTTVGSNGINTLDFRMTFKKVRFAVSEVDANAPRPRLIRVAKKKKKGGQATDQANDEEKKEGLAKLAEDVGAELDEKSITAAGLDNVEVGGTPISELLGLGPGV